MEAVGIINEANKLDPGNPKVRELQAEARIRKALQDTRYNSSNQDVRIAEAMSTGPIAGYPIEDIKVTLVDGSYHEVDSSEVAFKVAGTLAFRDGAGKAGAFLMEPIMALEVVVPEQYLGDVMGDLNSHRADIQGMTPRSDAQVVKAEIPLSETFGYATRLRSLTQGRAIFTMQFAQYRAVPKNITDEIVAKVRGEENH